MPRLRAIPDKIDTKYFEGVTPLWVPPDRQPIPEKYHPAVRSLAEWAGPEWPENESSGFFLMRTILLNSCVFWEEYDWIRNQKRWRDRRANDKNRASLKSAAIKFQGALSAAPFNSERLSWFRSITLNPEISISEKMTNASAIEAIDQGIRMFVDHVSNASKVPFLFGPLEYPRPPRTLPSKFVAIALYLADLVSIWRRDGLEEGSIDYPHKPRITKRLPWKAIAQFACPPGSDPDDSLNPNNVQSLVTSASKRIVRVTSQRNH